MNRIILAIPLGLLLTTLTTAVHCSAPNVTLFAIREVITLPESNLLMPEVLLICALTPTSLSPQNYTSRWTTPGSMVISSTNHQNGNSRYFINNERGPIQNGTLFPYTLLGIASLSYQDAGEYTCEARTNDGTLWESATVQLEMNMELRSNNGDKVTALSTDNSVELTCEMSGFIRPDESLTWVGPEGQIIMSGISFSNNASSPEAAADGSDVLVPSRISTLVISNPVASDSGNYTCRINETLQSVTIELFVNGSVTRDPTSSKAPVTLNGQTEDIETSMSEAPVTLNGQTDNKTSAIIGGVIGAVAVMILLTVIVVLIITYARKSCFRSDENAYDLPDYYARPQPPPIEDMPSRLQTRENVAYMSA